MSTVERSGYKEKIALVAAMLLPLISACGQSTENKACGFKIDKSISYEQAAVLSEAISPDSAYTAQVLCVGNRVKIAVFPKNSTEPELTADLLPGNFDLGSFTWSPDSMTLFYKNPKRPELQSIFIRNSGGVA